MNNKLDWLFMSLDELIDLEVDKKGEKNNDTTDYDEISDGITKSSSKYT